MAGTFYVSALMYDSTFTPDPYEVVHIMFDRTQATTSLIASSVSRMAASSRVVEAFDVVGVPPGTPVNGTLELRLDGWSEQNCGGSGCGVRLEGWLLSGMDSTEADANQFGPNLGRRFVATTLALPVTFVAGSPIEAHFFLTFDNGPGGGAQVEIQARYAVSGLPAGVQAVACQDVTPTRRDTWGRLKSSYR